MSQFHATYAPRGVLISFAGVDLSSGKGDGDFLNITPSSDRTDIRSGMDGNKSIALSPDHSYTVTYTVFPESTTAKLISSAVAALRELESAGVYVAGTAPLVIYDPSGVGVFVCPNAVINNLGDLTLGSNTGTKTFSFYCPSAKLFSANAADIKRMVEEMAPTGLPLSQALTNLLG